MHLCGTDHLTKFESFYLMKRAKYEGTSDRINDFAFVNAVKSILNDSSVDPFHLVCTLLKKKFGSDTELVGLKKVIAFFNHF